jgi:aminodeoxyfutalosine deaminase
LILRARIVLPVSQPPIENGAVALDQGKVIRVGTWEELGSPRDAIDLGDVILLPGLVNSHCHLDYSGMGDKILPPSSFPDWIKLLIGYKSETSLEQFAKSWLEGALMLAQTGTTTVADIESFPEILPRVLPHLPLRLFSFLEVLSPRATPVAPAEVLQNFLRRVPFERLGGQGAQPNRWPQPMMAGGVNPGWWFGLSPHAPYSTTPELLAACQELAARHGWRLASHISESEPEFQMYMYATGALHEWLRNQRDMADCGHGSPLRVFDQAGLIHESMLAVHMNYLWLDDAEILGRRGASVAHCPRSHRYFKHGCFPHRALTGAKVNICLGTDSMASMESGPNGTSGLNMFTEMQMFASWDSTVSAEHILRLATVNGAQALGLKGRLGQLSAGAYADLIAIPYPGGKTSVYEKAIHHQGPVSASMVGGRWVVPPISAELDASLPWLAGRPAGA